MKITFILGGERALRLVKASQRSLLIAGAPGFVMPRRMMSRMHREVGV